MEGRPVYNVLEEFLFLLFYMAEGYCLWRFYDSFLESRMRSGKWAGAAVIFFHTGIREAMSLLPAADYENPGHESLRVICNTAILFFILLILAVAFYRGGRRMIVFLFVTFLSVHEIAYLLAYTIWQMSYQLLIRLALRHMEKGSLSADGLMNILYAGGNGMLLLTCTTSVLLLYSVLKNIIKNFRNREYDIHRKELFFLLTPGMIGLLICMLLRITMFFVEQEKITVLYDRYPVLVIIVPLICLLSLLFIPYGVKVFQDMIELNRERSDRVILENQIRGMQRQMEEMEHIYTGIRSMKHDMQNTVSVMMQLAAESAGADTERRNGNMRHQNRNMAHRNADAELQNYLAEFQRTFEQLDFRYRTGNAVIDTLLNMKYHEISHMLPDLELDADRLLFPEPLYIQSYDMGVILGNALDNALEACRRLHEKEGEARLFIRLSSFRRGNMFFLEVENSFDGKLIRRAQAEFPETGKADREAHGVGLMNIRNAVQKYHGAVDWSVKDKVFMLSVMMQNRMPVT